jgi:hypothetical protein
MQQIQNYQSERIVWATRGGGWIGATQYF